MKLTRKELKTIFYVGRKLKLVHTLLGPTEQERTVHSHRYDGYAMEKPDGNLSYLTFESGQTIHGLSDENGNGFTHVEIRTREGEVAAKYVL